MRVSTWDWGPPRADPNRRVSALVGPQTPVSRLECCGPGAGLQCHGSGLPVRARVGRLPCAVTGARSLPQDASVRMKCILALKALYEKRESAMKLGLFFYKFKVRECLFSAAASSAGRRPVSPSPSLSVDMWTSGSRLLAQSASASQPDARELQVLWGPSPGPSTHASQPTG